jgi:carbamoyl-phosphate synthase small subunit
MVLLTVKSFLADVPDMKGLELASKVSTRNHYGDEQSTHRIAVLI